ncbi:uncharacterized protein [Hetaerina americana]|uniref:uncharacterized protein n=1 Tax=Hetaerina americana TaxID=62018 RepID=UPI003A7F416C
MSFNRNEKKSRGGYAVVESMISSYIWRAPKVIIQRHNSGSAVKQLSTNSSDKFSLPCFYNEGTDSKLGHSTANFQHRMHKSVQTSTTGAVAKRNSNCWNPAMAYGPVNALSRSKPVTSGQRAKQERIPPDERRARSIVKPLTVYDPRKIYGFDIKRKIKARPPHKSRTFVDSKNVSLELQKSNILERRNVDSVNDPGNKEARASRESLCGFSLSDQLRNSEIFQCQQVFDPTDYMELEHSGKESIR